MFAVAIETVIGKHPNPVGTVEISEFGGGFLFYLFTFNLRTPN